MQLMLAQKCAECRPDAFQMQVPTDKRPSLRRKPMASLVLRKLMFSCPLGTRVRAVPLLLDFRDVAMVNRSVHHHISR